MNASIANLSRRSFLASTGVFVLGVALPVRGQPLPLSPSDVDAAFVPNLFVQIDTAGVITITSHRSEMGQGIRTAIAQVVADELEADWSDVVVAQAPGDPIYGDQNTDGSRSILMYFESLREAGASAKQMLMQAAANSWDVAIDECRAENSQVLHDATGKSLAYGDLAELAAEIPVPSSVTKKNRADFKLIGKGKQHVDAEDIANGKALYGADVQLPNMAYAVMVHSPRLGGRVKSAQLRDEASQPDDASHRNKLVSIETIAPTPGPIMFNSVGGVAVVAEDTYSAIALSQQLDIEWEAGPNDSFDSEAFEEQLRTTVSEPMRRDFNTGDVDEVFATADTVIEGVYQTPFLSHAPMEPPVALANVSKNKIEVWAPVQDPQGTRTQIASAMSVSEEDVVVVPTLLGGAFGRKSKPDFVLEAVVLSMRLERPVRVQWTRANDIQHDYFHAANAQYYKAALGDDGMPAAWLQRSAFPTIMSTFNPLASQPAGFELEMGFTNTPYRCDNQRFESTAVKAGVRIGWLRSVCNVFHAFAANVFVDELANAANQDPIDYRLAMWPEKGQLDAPGQQPPPGHELDYQRLRAVLEEVRELSDWDEKRSAGRALGIAVHHSFRSYVATVIEVSESNSSFKVDEAFVTLDCGTYVNPDTCIAQMEGAVVFGLSLAQKSKISIKEGMVEQENFDGYQVLRMQDSPKISVTLTESTELPAGVGEPGVPPIAPALSNAVFALTGVRHRQLPIT